MSPVGVDPAFWRDKRVLITGHTGFKGAWLALWLEQMGARVHGLSNGVPTEPSLYSLALVEEGLTALKGDVRDADSVAGAVVAAAPEIVIHMAAQSLVRRSFDDPVGTYATNVMGTVNVLDAVRHSDGVRVVINVTSDKCYENREWEWGYREYEAKGGHDPYSSSKGCAELVTEAYRRSFFAAIPDGPRLASVRAGNVIGGGDWSEDRLIPDIMRCALTGAPVPIRNPDAVRPWQHVLNPLSGYLALTQALWDSPEFAAGWNFGPAEGDVRPVRWITERIGEMWPNELAWQLEEGPHPHEARYLKVDSSQARARLGWSPPWDLEQALESIVDWYGALGEGGDMKATTLRQIEAFQSQLGDT